MQAGGRRDYQHQHDDGRTEDGGDDGLAPLILPVDVLEMEHKGELVENERGARTERDRSNVDERRIRIGGEPDHSADENEHEAGHHVVKMNIAHTAAPPAMAPRKSRVEPRQGE